MAKTKEEKEQKRLMKAEKAVEKAGGIYYYWLNQHKNKEAGTFDKTVGAFAIAMAGSVLSKCTVVHDDGTRNPLKTMGNVITGIGIVAEGYTVVKDLMSVKQSVVVKTYLRHHPEEKEEFYNKVSEFLTKYEGDLL